VKISLVRNVLLALVVCGRACAAGSHSGPRDVAFVSVNVVPMDQERVLAGQTVLVRGERIAAIGPAAAVKVPEGAMRVEGTGGYLMPGLVDMHVHLCNPEDTLLYVANGVTTVRNMDGRPVHLLWRQRIAAGQMLGPTIYTASPAIHTARNAEEGRRLVRTYKRAGYDCIKVFDGVPREAYEAITATAKEAGIPVVGHLNNAVGLEGVLNARQSSIEHAEEFASVKFQHKTDTPDAELEKAARSVRDAGVWVCPTLIQASVMIQEIERLYTPRSRPELRFLSPLSDEDRRSFYKGNFTLRQARDFRQGWAFQKRIASALHREGVRVLLGTDTGVLGNVPGFSALDELGLLVETGSTPFEAVQAATRNPAQFWNAQGEFGTVSTGARADLILLAADPLADVGNVRKRLGVMVRGRWFSEARLHTMLDALPGHYQTVERRLKEQLATRPSAAGQYLTENDPFNSLLERLLTLTVLERGTDLFQKTYRTVRQHDAAAPLVQEETLDDVGYALLKREHPKEALAVFKLNLNAHPRSASAYDSLAEAYRRNGQTEYAVAHYRKALAIDPGFAHAKEMLEKLGAGKQ
jgi:imidazolonepropionase-like amidohydrolase